MRPLFEHLLHLILTGIVLVALPYMVMRSSQFHLKTNSENRDIILNQTSTFIISEMSGENRKLQILSTINNSKVTFSLKYDFNNTSNVYLKGNASSLSFHTYGEEVDLRIIVLAYNRSLSLKTCLSSLTRVNFEKVIVKLHIWIDRDKVTGNIDDKTFKVAQDFQFPYGNKSIHIHPYHVGILNQWVNAWRPRQGSKEIAVFLEDDMTVSPFIWQWLKSAHKAYRNRRDISGYGLSHPGMEHVHATHLDIPAKYTVYLYKVICTWGFSPHADSWRNFQEWFYKSESDPTFLPLVDGILPTQWFKGELRRGRERSLWEMWHIFYTHNSLPQQYVVLLNTAQEGLLAVNRHEIGTHDKGTARLQPICETWKPTYVNFPENPPKFGYDGQLENEKHKNISVQ